MRVVKGNILNITEGLIAHQVNANGVMGAGLALQVRQKYPNVYVEYLTAVKQHALGLGDAQIIQVSDYLWIVNIVAQQNYGRAKGKCYTDYRAFACGLRWIKTWQQCTNQPIYLPYGIGAGLAGGDWKRIEGIITEVLPDAVLVKLQ